MLPRKSSISNTCTFQLKFHTTPKSTKLHAVTNDEKNYRTSHQLETFGVYKNNAIYFFFKNLEINDIIISMTQELNIL